MTKSIKGIARYTKTRCLRSDFPDILDGLSVRMTFLCCLQTGMEAKIVNIGPASVHTTTPWFNLYFQTPKIISASMAWYQMFLVELRTRHVQHSVHS